MENQEIANLIEEQRKLQEAFKNLRLEMQNSVDYEAVNTFRSRYEALQLELDCLSAEINIAMSIRGETLTI